MLSFFRKNVQSLFVKAIVSVVALVMLFFGINSYQDQGVNVLASVGSREIKLEQYQQSLAQASDRIRRSYGPNAQRLMDMMNLKLQVLQQLINEALVVESAEKIGLALTDQELVTALKGVPRFRTDGRYDSARYHAFLKQIGQSSVSFESSFRGELLSAKYLALIGQGHLVSNGYVKHIYRRDATQYDIETLSVTPDMLHVTAEVSEREIKDYYEKHTNQFQAPAQVGIRYFTIGIGDVSKAAKISDKAIELYYKKHETDEFSKKQRYHALHILLKVPKNASVAEKSKIRDQAEGIYQQLLKHPARFGSLAKKRSEDRGSALKGGDLGWVEVGQFVPVFDQTMGKLKPGELSKPFLSKFGYHVAKLIETKPAGVRPLAEVQTQIVARLNQQKAQRRLKNLHRKATQAMMKESLAEFASAQHKTLKKSGLFDAQSPVPGLPNPRSLYQTLKNQSVGERGALLQGSFVVVYEVTESKAPQTRPLDQVKLEVEMLAKTEKEHQLTQDNLEHLAKEIKTSVGFDRLVKSMKQPILKRHLRYKDRQIPGLKAGRELPIALNRMKVGEVRFLIHQGQGYAVRLVKRTEPDPKSLPAGVNQLKGNLSRQKAKILISGLIGELQKTVTITYNRKLLTQLGVNQGR